jgi:hypothetical protein
MINLKRMKLAGHVARMGERMDAYSILVGGPEGKRQLGILGTETLKWIFRKSDRDMDWIGLPQGRNSWWAVAHATTNRPAA